MNVEVKNEPRVILDLSSEEYGVLRALVFRHLKLGSKLHARISDQMNAIDEEIGLNPITVTL